VAAPVFTRFVHTAAPLALAAMALMLLGCIPAAQGPSPTVQALAPREPVGGLSPALTAAADLAPGLAVLYFKDFIERHVDKLPSGDAAVKKGQPGKPVPFLNHQFGHGTILDSGQDTKIGMEFKGYILLNQTGAYTFQALSNDGLRILIGGRVIIDDPDVHSDRLSSPGTLIVDKPGWYDFKAHYFQRKGTAALVLNWKPPADADFSPVPANAYAHAPAGAAPKP
jgi:hypothetical protein